MEMQGSLFTYGPYNRLCAFKSGYEHWSDVKIIILFVAGLTDGMISKPYLPQLSKELNSSILNKSSSALQYGASNAKTMLVQATLGSSYMGFGNSSLCHDVHEMDLLLDEIVHKIRVARGHTTDCDRDVAAMPKLFILGHSTGCQDALHYCKHGKYGVFGRNKEHSDFLAGIILQGPVSDREYGSGTCNPSDVALREACSTLFFLQSANTDDESIKSHPSTVDEHQHVMKVLQAWSEQQRIDLVELRRTISAHDAASAANDATPPEATSIQRQHLMSAYAIVRTLLSNTSVLNALTTERELKSEVSSGDVELPSLMHGLNVLRHLNIDLTRIPVFGGCVCPKHYISFVYYTCCLLTQTPIQRPSLSTFADPITITDIIPELTTEKALSILKPSHASLLTHLHSNNPAIIHDLVVILSPRWPSPLLPTGSDLCPMTCSRWLSLNARLGTDDMFSSDVYGLEVERIPVTRKLEDYGDNTLTNGMECESESGAEQVSKNTGSGMELSSAFDIHPAVSTLWLLSGKDEYFYSQHTFSCHATRLAHVLGLATTSRENNNALSNNSQQYACSCEMPSTPVNQHYSSTTTTVSSSHGVHLLASNEDDLENMTRKTLVQVCVIPDADHAIHCADVAGAAAQGEQVETHGVPMNTINVACDEICHFINKCLVL